MKTVISVVGIRPDFIRMSEIFKKLDKHFHHILIHTGQHFDDNLSGIFFKELGIRKPDFNLEIGGEGKEHFHQSAELSVKLIELIRKHHFNPDIILFLGDSNSVLASVALKKEGYKIGHIEAGMRSHDKRMLEEINRIVCDHVSDYHFVYHENYKSNLMDEGICEDNIFVVGNTIVEVFEKFYQELHYDKKLTKCILLDIHRPENFKDKARLGWILDYANMVGDKYHRKVKMLNYSRTTEYIKKFNLYLNKIKFMDLMGYTEYLNYLYNSEFIISDSGTAQEEPALTDTKIIVPRDFTERPESIYSNCSFMLNDKNWNESLIWLDKKQSGTITWLGDGTTSDQIIKILTKIL